MTIFANMMSFQLQICINGINAKLMKYATSPDHISVFQIGAVLKQFETNVGVAFLRCTQQRRPVILRNYTET